MRSFTTFRLTQPFNFREHLLQWLSGFNKAVYLDTNLYRQDAYHAYDIMAGADSAQEITASAAHNPFEQLQSFYEQVDDWLLGYFSYELKNRLERLSSSNPDFIQFPDMFFFQPQHVILLRDHELSISSLTEEPEELYKAITSCKSNEQNGQSYHPPLQAQMSKDEYLAKVEAIQEHIRQGDVYELNLCQEFYADGYKLTDPASTFSKFNNKAEAPFSAYLQQDGRYLLCSSPERFLAKRGSQLISQPIKGTAKRGSSKSEDEQLKQELRASTKEQAENVMIVDLVRNDLAMNAVTGSVHVDELFGIYTFKHVHQMISTITAQLKEGQPFAQAIADAFPMGSMTGTPKVSAMELIDHFETTKRGLFSGSVGYISPQGDFDFNVVIRSILYNAFRPYISVPVGGAITIDSDPEAEYQECLVKAQGMRDVLKR